ncbi:hypothetical protein D3C71_2232090 [compost metagenome]
MGKHGLGRHGLRHFDRMRGATGRTVQIGELSIIGVRPIRLVCNVGDDFLRLWRTVCEDLRIDQRVVFV